jgi:hypothetical protein
MSVKITGIAEAKRTFEEIEKFLASPKPMQGIVDDIAKEIKVKTARGVDYMGRSFKPYSKRYAEKKRGMTATGRPNLKLSGTMMGAIKTEVIDPRHGVVTVAPAAEKGRANAQFLAQIHTLGTGKQPQREFVNIALAAVKRLTKKHYDDGILELARAVRK